MVSGWRFHTRRVLAAVGLATMAVVGCGEAGPARVPLHRVLGKVLVDGQPEAGVEVRFRPADAPDSLDALVPYGRTDEQGNFVLGTYDPEDGAPAGRYKVTLFWPDRPPGPQHPEDRLGGVYATAERTSLEATIREGEQTIPTFEVAKSAARPTKASPRRNRPVDNDGLE